MQASLLKIELAYANISTLNRDSAARWLAHDLAQEILDHAPVSEEEPVAEVVLSHDFPSLDSTT
jgi:hypothetical protein